jgi:hypothetical protein
MIDNTPVRLGLNSYVDMHEHNTQEKIEAELSRVLVPSLARAALAMKGAHGAGFEMRYRVQKDMWDNYGDAFRFCLGTCLPACVEPANVGVSVVANEYKKMTHEQQLEWLRKNPPEGTVPGSVQ